MNNTTLIQHYNFNVPQTTGARVYTYTFKSDDLHKYLTGISLIFQSNTTIAANSLSIELRDDFKSILSFSPYQNWIKKGANYNLAYNLSDAFKPLCIPSAGKNFYLNVKAVGTTEDINFWCFFRQDNEQLNCKIYDIQTFSFENISLGVNYQINLPNDYAQVAGVNAVFDSNTDSGKILLDINDSSKNLLDPYSLEALKVTEYVNYDNSFFSCNFYSKNKQVNIRFTSDNNNITIPNNISICLLFIK